LQGYLWAHYRAKREVSSGCGDMPALRVIGLGWPRTGTGSLCDALEALGLGPCYHMRTLLRQGSAAWEPWESAANEPANLTRRAEWVLKALRGYASAADVPTVAFWKELLHAHEVGLLPPSVRFVLPRRPAAEWYESAEATVLAGWRRQGGQRRQTPRSEHGRRMARIVWAQLFGRPELQLPNDRQLALDAYERHQKEVSLLVPQDSLVHWAPEEGWSGLCRALSIPDPGHLPAFPWRNRRHSPVGELLLSSGRVPGTPEWPTLRGAILALSVLAAVAMVASCGWKGVRTGAMDGMPAAHSRRRRGEGASKCE